MRPSACKSPPKPTAPPCAGTAVSPPRYLRYLMRGMLAFLLTLGPAACGDGARNPTAPEPIQTVVLSSKSDAPPDGTVQPEVCQLQLVRVEYVDGIRIEYYESVCTGGGSGGDDGGGGGGGSGGGGDTCDPKAVIGGCDDYGGGGGGGTPVDPIAPFGGFGDDLLQPTEPDCTKPQTHRGAIAWCAGAPLNYTERSRASAAFNRMAQRGDACRQFADRGRILMNAGRIRSYPYQGLGTESGWGGAGYGIALQNTWFEYYWNRPSGEPQPRNLDMAFTHELYHDRNPSYNHPRGGFNPLDRQCSGL